MLTFSDEFFLEEERCGYIVPKKMKHIWAEDLEMISELNIICKKYGISYSAYFGTLLGAVRHQGFIPWDDDVDICMLREDYEKLLKILPIEKPSWIINQPLNGKMKSAIHTSVMNTDTVRVDEDYLKNHHNCPYIVGFDIFVLDAVPDDDNEFEAVKVIYDILYRSYMNYEELEKNGELEKEIAYIEDFCHCQIKRDEDVKLQIWNLLLVFSTIYNDADCKKVQFYPALVTTWMSDRNWRIPKEYLTDIEYVKYENIEIPVSRKCNEMLEKLYGEHYMTPIRGQRHLAFEVQDEFIEKNEYLREHMPF